MKFQFALFVFVGLYLTACSTDENSSEASSDKSETIDWSKVPLDSSLRHDIDRPMTETFNLSKSVKQNDELLAEFEVSSEKLSSDTLGMKIINMEVDAWLKSNFYLNEDDYKVENIDTLIARYEQFLKAESEAIEFAMNWEINAGASILFSNNGLISYELGNYSYTGGAHGNANFIYRNYDVISGNRLTIEDVFSDSMKVKNMLNSQFTTHASKDIQESISVDEIPLTSNFFFAKDSISFFYNSYEIGPYSMGPVTIKLAVVDLVDNLKVVVD